VVTNVTDSPAASIFKAKISFTQKIKTVGEWFNWWSNEADHYLPSSAEGMNARSYN
jgi:hypothetical protein